MHPDSISGWFRKTIARTDLPQISIHSLRHTNITLMLTAGVPIRTVSYRVGHAQTTTTAYLYAHTIQSADEMAAEKDMLNPTFKNIDQQLSKYKRLALCLKESKKIIET